MVNTKERESKDVFLNRTQKALIRKHNPPCHVYRNVRKKGIISSILVHNEQHIVT